MNAFLKLRINGWIFLAFTCLYGAIMCITAFFSTIGIIGICYSDFIGTQNNQDGHYAVYEYIVDDEPYRYQKPIETAELLMPQVETVFYFREYPSVRTGSLEIFIYPAFIALFGLGFALIFKHGVDNLDENSPKLGEYLLPIAVTVLSLFPVCKNVFEVCGLYTSVLSAFTNAEESVYSISTTLGIINMNLLMWGVWAKMVEHTKNKRENNNRH